MNPLKYSFELALCLLFCASVSQAETIVEKRIAATKRLIPLKKLTIGPDDQYHGVTDPSGQYLIFTHKADLVSHLKIQNLKTGLALDLLPLTADSQEPASSPTGLVAFSYYKFNARGDICYIDLPNRIVGPVPEDQIKCLKRTTNDTDIERASPFWKSNDEIGFVVRDIQNKIWKIVSQNIKTGSTQVLAEGKVWSPAMKAGGHYLVYDQISEVKGQSRRNLVLKDLTTSQTKTVYFSIPGISGFPTLSDDEKYLYFSHYLNDTNHDNVIDGSDNAVIFRISIQKIIASKENEELFPEQMTSVESSCSYPRPLGDILFVTCAFEGNLDVYSLPASGIVPADWTTPVLQNALQTSRTYQDRVLILNTLKFRNSQNDLTEKLLTNHILADDTSAARYYLAELNKAASTKDKTFYALLDLYLKARELKKSQTSKEITRAFQAQLQTIESQVTKIQGEPNFQSIVRGLIHVFLEQNQIAGSFLEHAHLSAKEGIRPLERFLHFELANKIHPTVDAYLQMMKAPELSEEAQLYYAFNLLRLLESQNTDLEVHTAAIEKLNKDLPAPVTALLKSEASTLKLIQKKDAGEKAYFYRELDKLMTDSSKDYFLRKALYVRSILNFTVASEFQYLSYVAINWLRYTNNGDTEFIYAREVLSNSALDQAYSYLGQKNFMLAGNFFYESISLTDDLESHYGYIKTMILKNQRATINDRYKNLSERKFIDDNMKFVDALLLLIDHPNDVKTLDIAAEKLQQMEQDRDSAVRYLLLGYCHLQKLILERNGNDVNQELFQQANRELMLAYDLGRENDRLKASALLDLGILHQAAHNAGLSVRFFSLRKALSFVSPEEQSQFEWLYSRSLFYNRQSLEAATELDQVPQNLMTPPFQERQAFYWMDAGQYEKSSRAYSTLLAHGQIVGDLNLAKAHLNQGFNSFKLKNPETAKAEFKFALTYAAKVNPEPVQVKMILYGLLAQVSVGAEKVDALESRSKLLSQSSAILDEWLPTVIQNKLQLAEAYSSVKDLNHATDNMKDALNLTIQYGDANQYFGGAVFHTVVDFLSHGLLHPEKYASEDKVKGVVEKTVKTYEGQKVSQPILDAQNLKVQILWAAYRAKVLKTPGASTSEINTLLASDLGKKVQSNLPTQWIQLESLAKAIH